MNIEFGGNAMWYYYYPVVGGEKELPVYVEGIGLNDIQYHAIRENGYHLPQFLYCTEGAGELIVGGKKYCIKPGQAFFLPSGEPHEYYTTGQVWDTHWVVMGGNGIENILEKFGFTQAAVYTFSDVTKLNHIFKKIYSTLKTDLIYGNYYAGGYAYEFLVEFYRLANNKPSAVNTDGGGTILTAVNYIDSHFKEGITLEKLCEATGITKQHICKLFKRNFSMTPVEYVTKTKLRHAKRLLLTSPLTVKAISEELGFSDCGYFCRTFRKYELMSPTEYRRTSYK